MIRFPKAFGLPMRKLPIFSDPSALPRTWRSLLLPAVFMELLFLAILRLSRLQDHLETFIPLILLLAILYFVSLYLVERIAARKSLLWFVFLVAVAFRLTLFPLPPSLSEDLYRYRWEGQVQRAGYNPYLVRPTDPDLVSLLDPSQFAVSGPEFSTVYGPLLEELYWLSVVLTENVVLLKLPYLLFDLGIILLLFRWLPQCGVSPARALVYAWNPLPVIEFAASGHNDSLPVFALVLALLLLERQRAGASLAALAASALAKLYAVFLLPVFLLRAGWKKLWIPCAAALVVSVPYAGAWRQFPTVLSDYMRSRRTNESLYYFLRQAVETNWQGWIVYLLIILGVVVYCLARRSDPRRASFLILGTMLVLAPTVFPWYLTWILPLLAIHRNLAWLLWTVTVFLSYHVLIPYHTLGLWQEQTLFRLLEYVPFYILLVGEFLARRWRSQRADS